MTGSRSQVLAHARIAGYHDDKRKFTRLLVENRISTADMERAWREGKRIRQQGMKCTCPECNQ